MSATAFTPGPPPRTVTDSSGQVVNVPEGWVLLPPGDAALTRRVKAAGDHFQVQEKKGRKVFSRWYMPDDIDDAVLPKRAELRSPDATFSGDGSGR